jgi:hypothetical protein
LQIIRIAENPDLPDGGLPNFRAGPVDVVA